MTREEMAGELRQLLSELSDVHPSRYALSEAIFAFSSPCACEGREPIWDGGAEIFDVRGNRCQADAGAIVFRAKGIKEGTSLYLLGFLPAKEVT